MLKGAVSLLLSVLYPASPIEEERVERFLSAPYRTNAGKPSEPLFPVAVKQRTLHKWEWAVGAPEQGIPNHLRRTSIIQSCTICGATSMMDHRATHLRYLIGYAPMFVPQPICPATCQETIEFMKTSTLSPAERRGYFEMWNDACRTANTY